MKNDLLHLKANSRGSWTNVCCFPSSRLDNIKTACEGLVVASGGCVSFKIVDDRNVTRHALDARVEPVGWSDR